MNPTKTIPATYSLAWQVDMKKDTRLNWILQIVGTVWFFIAAWALWQVVAVLRPEYFSMEFKTESVWDILLLLVIVVLVIFVTLTVHELVHGLSFWLFTRARPVFGLGAGYAYAAAPDWFFPKSAYLVVGLSPLVILTLVGLAVIPIIPVAWVGSVFLAVVFNAGGAIGDLYICLRIAKEARDILVRDSGDIFEIYRVRVE